MSVHIRKTRSSKRWGHTRYCVSFASGLPMEFLIQSAPRPQTREWQILFARALAATLLRWADYHDGGR